MLLHGDYKIILNLLQKRACEFVPSSPTLFSSAQCVGYNNENGALTENMCMPSIEIVVKQLRRLH